MASPPTYSEVFSTTKVYTLNEAFEHQRMVERYYPTTRLSWYYVSSGKEVIIGIPNPFTIN